MTPMRLSGWVEDMVAPHAPWLAKSVSLRTTISDDVVLITGDDIAKILRQQPLPEKPPTAGSRLMYALKPTIIVDSPALGPQVIAPFGVAKKGSAKQNIGRIQLALALVVGGLVATGFVLGRSIK